MDKVHDELFGNADAFFEYEYRVALGCVLPTLRDWGVEIKDRAVLDIGCGSGGLTIALAENSAACVGIDLNPVHVEAASRLANARALSSEFATVDILLPDQLEKFLTGRVFQVIVLSEVLEHLVRRDNVARLLNEIKKYLTETGYVYVSFPPWFNPFGGHQAGWPRIRYCPWFHLYPEWLQRVVAPAQIGQYRDFEKELNHLTIACFERTAREAGFMIAKKELFHLRPEYYFRYGVPALRATVFGKIPGVREVVTTGAYYLLSVA